MNARIGAPISRPIEHPPAARAVHRVAGEPTCFVYHWYQGQFATEIVRPRSWTVLRPEAVASEVFHDLDFDDAFVIR